MPITDLSEVREGQLTWPEHKPRASHRAAAAFTKGLDSALREIDWEMQRWGVVDFVVSRNKVRIYAGDPGVALWWLQKRKGATELRVLACDKWDNMGHNAHAIALTLASMRALERWGAYTAEQAAEGARLALPPPAGMERIDWRTLLEMHAMGSLPKEDQRDVAERRYRRKASENADDQAMLLRLNLAIEAARSELAS